MENACNEGFLLGRTGRAAPKRRAVGFHAEDAPEPEEDDSLIRYSGDSPLMTLAPTGAGKSSGPVICNLLNHPGQAIVLDVKGKVYELTAEHRRRMGQEIHVLDLRDGNHGKGALNPFDIARRLGTEISSTCRAFASEIVHRTGNERETFWVAWAETMVTAGLAYLWQHVPEEERRISKLYDLYHPKDTTYSIAVLLDTTIGMNKTAYDCWAAYLELSERETRPSVLASTTEHLHLYESDLIRRLTDTTTIDLDALVAGEPMTIYITVPPYRLAAYSPILRLWLSGLMNLLGTRQSVPKHRTLMLVDEAGQLGRMESFITASTLMREYGLSIWTIWQNAAQLEIYGSQARTLIDNAGVIQCFGMRNSRMAGEIAALIGGISAERLVGMGKDEQMLAIDGAGPKVVRQIRYYEEPWLWDGGPTR